MPSHTVIITSGTVGPGKSIGSTLKDVNRIDFHLDRNVFTIYQGPVITEFVPDSTPNVTASLAADGSYTITIA